MKLVVFGLLISVIGISTASLADTPAPPHSWREEVGPDKKYVFVMQVQSQGCRSGIRKTITDAELAQLPPRWAVEAGRSRRACDPQQILWTKKTNSETHEVDAAGTRRIVRYYEVQYADGVAPEAIKNARGVPYPASGLYRNDGSTVPLWSVDWYSFRADLSHDGRYLIRHGPWASSFKQLAIAFYDRGVLLKEYRIGDLISERRSVRYTASHFFWFKGGAFDQKSLRYRLETTAGDRYEFDATTGAIVSKIPPGRAAIVEYTDGTRATFAALFSCFAINAYLGPDPDVFYGEKTGRGAKPNITVISSIQIPLGEIRLLTRAHEGAARNTWSLSMVDGSIRSVEHDTVTTFCHRDAKGVRTPFAVEKIRSIELTR